MDENRAFLSQIKLEKGCEECGYKAHAAALQFDHINPLEKSFTISKRTSMSLEKLKAEVAKCRVLCANCHAVHTHQQNHHAKIRRGH